MAKREQELIEMLRTHRPEPPPAPPRAWAALRQRLDPVAPAPSPQRLFWGLGGGLAMASALWMLSLAPPAQGPAEDPTALEAFVIDAGSALFQDSRSPAGEDYFALLESLS